MFGIRILFGFLAIVWKESIGILLIFLIVVYIMLIYELDNRVQVVGVRVCKQRQLGTMASWGYEAAWHSHLGSPHEGSSWYCKGVSDVNL